jgi:F-type H+-transporting ATPase subunit gamma
MQAAERSIEEHLEEQQAEFRRRRQETITEELLDLVTGFEAAT